MPKRNPNTGAPCMEAQVICDALKIAHELLSLGNDKEPLCPILEIFVIPDDSGPYRLDPELFRIDLFPERESNGKLCFIGYDDDMVKLQKVYPTQFVCEMGVHFNIESYVNFSEILEPSDEKLSRILKEKKFCDFILVSRDGKEFPCHKLFLAGSSQRFAVVLSSSFKEGQEGKLKMEDMSNKSVEAFLEYIYCSSLFSPCGEPVIAYELLKASDFYDLPRLWIALAKMLLAKPAKWFGVDVALSVYDFVKKKDEKSESGPLTEKMIKVLSVKKEKLDKSRVFTKLFPDVASRNVFKSGLAVCKQPQARKLSL